MVGSIDDRIRPGHPIRPLKRLADMALASMSDLFEGMYAAIGRPSVPPERLLKAQLLIALFSVRSDRQFCEQLDFNLMFRWFLDMDLDEPAFDASTFSQNRERLIRHRVGEEFLAAVVREARKQRLLSDDHFSVDGTLIEEWASIRSFRRKDDPPGDANGQPAKLSFCGNVLMENRNGLVIDLDLAIADGRAERDGALRLLRRRKRRAGRRKVAADKGYEARGFVDDWRDLGVMLLGLSFAPGTDPGW